MKVISRQGTLTVIQISLILNLYLDYRGTRKFSGLELFPETDSTVHIIVTSLNVLSYLSFLVGKYNRNNL